MTAQQTSTNTSSRIEEDAPARRPAGAPARTIGRRAPGDQLVLARVDEYDYLIRTLPAEDRAGLDQLLASARDALAHRGLARLPRPRYDAAWAQLHHLRSFLCQKIALGHLLGVIAEDVEADIEYLDAREAREARRELDDLRHKVRCNLEGGKERTTNERLLRARLEALSKDTGEAHDAQWLRVNMIRHRLTVMGLALAVVVPAVIWRLPVVLDERTTAFYFLLALFGAMGGLISAVLGRDSLEDRVAEYYIRRHLLLLRPLIGAALALVSFCAVRFGLVSFGSVNEDSVPGEFLAVAFLAGFAERAFVKRILDSTSGQGRGATRSARRGADD